MLKIRRSHDRLIINMGNPYTGKRTSLYWDGPLVVKEEARSSKSMTLALFTCSLFWVQHYKCKHHIAVCLQDFYHMACLGRTTGDLHTYIYYKVDKKHVIYVLRNHSIALTVQSLNILRLSMLKQNGHHFDDNIFKCTFLQENCSILIQISLKYVP